MRLTLLEINSLRAAAGDTLIGERPDYLDEKQWKAAQRAYDKMGEEAARREARQDAGRAALKETTNGPR